MSRSIGQHVDTMKGAKELRTEARRRGRIIEDMTREIRALRAALTAVERINDIEQRLELLERRIDGDEETGHAEGAEAREVGITYLDE